MAVGDAIRFYLSSGQTHLKDARYRSLTRSCRDNALSVQSHVYLGQARLKQRRLCEFLTSLRDRYDPIGIVFGRWREVLFPAHLGE